MKIYSPCGVESIERARDTVLQKMARRMKPRQALPLLKGYVYNGILFGLSPLGWEGTTQPESLRTYGKHSFPGEAFLSHEPRLLFGFFSLVYFGGFPRDSPSGKIGSILFVTTALPSKNSPVKTECFYFMGYRYNLSLNGTVWHSISLDMIRLTFR